MNANLTTEQIDKMMEALTFKKIETMKAGEIYNTLKDIGIKTVYKLRGTEIKKNRNLLINRKKDKQQNQINTSIIIDIEKGKIREELFLFRTILKKQKIKAGKWRVVLYNVDDKKILKDSIYDIPGGKIDGWFKKNNIHNHWRISSEITKFEYPTEDKKGLYDNKQLIFSQEILLKPEKFIQHFRFGLVHCFFNPVLEWIKGKIETTKTKKKNEYISFLRRLKEEEIKYDKGINEDEIKMICNKYSFGVVINDIINKEMINISPDGKNETGKVFKYLNTRDNHIDYGVSDGDIVEITREEMNIKEKELENKYYYFYGRAGKINILMTKDGAYKVITESNKYFKEFEKETKLKGCYLDAVKYPDLCGFIRMSAHVSACIDYVDINEFRGMEDEKGVKQIDQIKSYSQFKECDFYNGFPGIITDFRKCPEEIKDINNFLDSHLGFFKVSNINIDLCKDNIKNHFEKLNYLNEVSVFSSVELKFYFSIGIRFNLLFGAWCSKPFYFEFDERMIEGKIYETKEDEEDPKIKGIPYYSVWSGKCGSFETESKIKLYTSPEMAGELKEKYKHVEYYNDRTCEISMKKKEINNLIHIFSFITSYSRIHLLSQLFKFDSKNIIRVNMDGIYYHGKTPHVYKTFRDCKNKIKKNYCSGSFVSQYDIDYKEPEAKYRKCFNRELFIGKGGSGKTHAALTDEGFINVLFSACSWKLTREKMIDYGISGTVFNRLLGIGCYSEYIENPPGVLIVDEATMITNEFKESVIKKFPLSKIIFCGDFDLDGTPYQLPPHGGGLVMNFKGIENIEEYKINHRCNCPILTGILDTLREMIKNGDKGGEIEIKLLEMMKGAGRVFDRQYVKENYKIENYILCSRRRCDVCKLTECKHKDNKNFVGEWSEEFKGKFDKEKYLILKISKYQSTGDIVIDNKKPAACEVRHAFTIHAVQGLTVTDEIYIDSRGFFNNKMSYVALSRAKNINQIYFII